MVTYTAVDQSGNRATCFFAIKVVGNKVYFFVDCHNKVFIIRDAKQLYVIVFLIFLLPVISCTSLSVSSGGELRMSRCGSYFGAHCNFTCASGYRLNGSSAVTCVAPSNKPPGYWDNPLPTCQGTKQ